MASSSSDNSSNSDSKKEWRLATSSGHGHGDRGGDRWQRSLQAERESREARAARAASPAPAPSVLRQWAEDLFAGGPDWLSPSSCSGCLGQVDDREEGDDDDDEVGETVRNTARTPSRFSFLHRDSDSGRWTPATANSTDVTVRTSHRRGARKSAWTFGSVDEQDEGVEVPASQCCPLCLDTMSSFDVLYPIQCPAACGYNFCVNCMESLLRSSREDYQLASDGSRQLKVWLRCPECSASIAGIIEEVIESRRAALAAASPTSSRTESTIANYPKPGPRLKNRSGAPRHVRQKRIDDLIETVESMAVPSLLRDRASVVRGRMARQGSDSSASQHSQSSSSSVEVQVARPLSSMLSSTFRRSSVSTVSEAESTALPSTPSRSLSLERLASPQVNRLTEPSRLRRIQSLQVPFSPRPQAKKASPRSILDVNYFSDDEGEQQIESTKPRRGHPPRPQGKKAKGGQACLEGINFAESEGSFFSDTIDLDWCCYDLNNLNLEKAPSEDCGGYVDYLGAYHPCTNVEGEESVEPCQGCIFRRGTYDGRGDDERGGKDAEEWYYDSDPGQHFAITSWTVGPLSREALSLHGSLHADEERRSSLGAMSSSLRRRAKRGWRRRRRRRGRSSRGGGRRAEGGVAAPREDLRRQQEAQQAYLYGYFSRYDDAGGDAMRTGFCSTREEDVHNLVQDALNSKWRLQWHLNAAQSSKAGNQGRVPPIACDAWIERGYRHSRTEIVEPKLMWSQTSSRENRQLGGSSIRPYRVSLFAIRRIFEVATAEDWERLNKGRQVQSSLMPMARPDCLLVVRSSLGEDYVFEASCPRERDRVAHLLKAATARLVSHAVVGNGDLMVGEFFNEEFVSGGVDLDASLASAGDDD